MAQTEGYDLFGDRPQTAIPTVNVTGKDRIHGLALQGDPNSSCMIGNYYYYGHCGYSQDFQKAFHWYQLASNAGNAEGTHNLGHCYLSGSGICKDELQAFSLFHEAARYHNSEAQKSIGCCYLHGTGPIASYLKALQWFTLAANQGNNSAQCNIGVIYTQGLGVKQNDQVANEYFLQAANSGHPASQCNLGQCNLGQCPGSNKVTSIEWLRKAAASDHPHAQFLLYCHLIETHTDEAAEYLVRAFDQGHFMAQYMMGTILIEEGEPTSGLHWIRMSAEKSYQPALDFLRSTPEISEHK